MVIFTDKLSDISPARPHPLWQFATINANQLVFVTFFSKGAKAILDLSVFVCSVGQIAGLKWQQIDHYVHCFGRATVGLLSYHANTNSYPNINIKVWE